MHIRNGTNVVRSDLLARGEVFDESAPLGCSEERCLFQCDRVADAGEI